MSETQRHGVLILCIMPFSRHHGWRDYQVDWEDRAPPLGYRSPSMRRAFIAKIFIISDNNLGRQRVARTVHVSLVDTLFGPPTSRG